jgi:hypothetical protein
MEKVRKYQISDPEIQTSPKRQWWNLELIAI